MTFQAICPFCGGRGGGIVSVTLGLPPKEALEQLKDNSKRRCSTCKGKGYVMARLAEEADHTNSPTVAFGRSFPTDRRCVKSGNPCGTDTRTVGHPCDCPQCLLWMDESLIHSLYRGNIPKRPTEWGEGDYRLVEFERTGRTISWYVFTDNQLILGPMQEEEAKWWKELLSIVLPPSKPLIQA